MKLCGWEQKYREILREFSFDRKDDTCAAHILNLLVRARFPLYKLECEIKNRVAFVIGAGPSLSSSIPFIKKFKKATKIVADGATRALIENGIRPDIVVTDLDGNLEYLKKASKMDAVMVVHSHGDNIGILPIASLFMNCIGTTEGKQFGKIKNFGGFTDGDRCVFLARYFEAKRIILFGMDFGNKIGAYSKEERYNKAVKLQKLRKARTLLEWLAAKDSRELYTTSEPIKGFQSISFGDLQELVRE